ncbi:MAG: LacI family DNA-binding transcriptional regulator [Nocardioides sp.]|nr:LacI family DNA-binding transcriptional regulator [Nocardioides sp.]
MTDRRVTLRDVAAHAGVSPRTVSNVVNDFAHVSPAMRTKVQAAVEALGYKPNMLARGLRQGRTGIITLLVPDLTVAYFAELAHDVVERATELGATVMVDETGGDAARERALLDTAAESSWVDGVLLSSLGLSAHDLAGLGSRLRVVLLGERTAGSALDHVGFDNVAAARDAVSHLIAQGRTRIVAVGGNGKPLDMTSHLRLQGYHEAMSAAGLPTADGHVLTPDYLRRSAREAVERLMARPEPPDALFCFSDELAVGALRALYDRGARVPDDVAVVGFDDAGISAYLTPGLTSIRQDRSRIARGALDVLFERIRGDQGPPRDLSVPYELVVRESSMIISPPQAPPARTAPDAGVPDPAR